MHIDKINSIAKKKYNNCIYIVAGAFFVGLIMFISTFLLVNTQIFFSDELYLGGKLLEYEMGNNAPDTYYGLSSFLIFLLIKTGLIRKLSLLNVLLNILKIFCSMITTIIANLVLRKISTLSDLTTSLLSVFSVLFTLVLADATCQTVISILLVWTLVYICISLENTNKVLIFSLALITNSSLLVINDFKMIALIPGVIYLIWTHKNKTKTRVILTVMNVLTVLVIFILVYYKIVGRYIFNGVDLHYVYGMPQNAVLNIVNGLATFRNSKKSLVVLLDIIISNTWYLNVFSMGTFIYLLIYSIKRETTKSIKQLSLFISSSALIMIVYSAIVNYSDVYSAKISGLNVNLVLFSVANVYPLLTLIIPLGCLVFIEVIDSFIKQKIYIYVLGINALAIIYLSFRVMLYASKLPNYYWVNETFIQTPIFGRLTTQNTIFYNVILLVICSSIAFVFSWLLTTKNKHYLFGILIVLLTIETFSNVLKIYNSNEINGFIDSDKKYKLTELTTDIYSVSYANELQHMYLDTCIHSGLPSEMVGNYLIHVSGNNPQLDTIIFYNIPYLCEIDDNEILIFNNESIKSLLEEDGYEVLNYQENYAIDNLIRRIYINLLGREPETYGFDYFKVEIGNKNITIRDFINQVFFSSEFDQKGFSKSDELALLYRSITNEDLTQDEIKYWLEKTNNATNLDPFYDECIDEDYYNSIIEANLKKVEENALAE